MRDYAQYTATPMKSKNGRPSSNAGSSHSVPSSSRGGMVTPSPSTASTAVYSSSHYHSTKVRSQVEIMKEVGGGGASTSTTNTMSTSGANEQLEDSPNSHVEQRQQQHPNAQQQSPTASTPDSNNTGNSNNKKSRGHRSSSKGSNANANAKPLDLSAPLPQHHGYHVHTTRTTSHPLQQQQQQQHEQDVPAASSPSRSTHSNNSHHQSLSTADALSLRREGPEATIRNLRHSLEEVTARDYAEKTQLAKSDATILELRSSVRQLKRQLEKVDQESRQKHAELQDAKRALHELKKQQQQQKQSDLHSLNSSTASTLDQQAAAAALAKEERVGELQVELDRAHAQILTADMVRKELEDTLEAEQYTWELRVQDQERTIVELQQDCATLAEDLEDCRRQWKLAEEAWANDIADLQQQLEAAKQVATNGKQQRGLVADDNDEKKEDVMNEAHSRRIDELQEKLRQVEAERNELQTCLDEALQELEAVDAELGSHTPEEVQQLREDNQRLKETVERQRKLQEQQQLQQGDEDFDTVEGLQHLYRWLLEQKDENDTNTNTSLNGSQVLVPQTSPELLDAIHLELESLPALLNEASQKSSLQDAAQNAALTQTVAELEAQLTVYRGDLKAREESSAELRASLKEAVALIKPLQDAVDKADRQKADLQQEVERLRSTHDEETAELQKELREAETNLTRKETEVTRLKQDVHRLQLQLDETKDLAKAREALHGLSPTAAAAAAAAAKQQQQHEHDQQHMSKARADLLAKRAQEKTLRALLKDAQNRFSALNQQALTVEARNVQLQGRVKEAEEQLIGRHGIDDGSVNNAKATMEQISALQQEVSMLTSALEQKTAELEELRRRPASPSPEMKQRIKSLEERVAHMTDELKKKKDTEKSLNRSLKEALSLLKPMQCHLEDAEEENKELNKEIKILRRKLTAMEISGMGAVVAKTPPTSPSRLAQQQQRLQAHPRSPTREKGNDETAAIAAAANEALRREKKELEETVRQLEQENSQLHDALEEMSRMNSPNNSGSNSQSVNNGSTSTAEVRLKEEIVELKSRYEVTYSRLEDAYVENRTLVDALREKEESEKDAVEGMRILREKLRRAETDLDNAKYIATSALVKVETLKASENDISMSSAFERAESHTIHSLEEKAIELDLLAAKAVAAATAATSPLHNTSVSPRHHGPAGANTTTWAGKRSRLADF